MRGLALVLAGCSGGLPVETSETGLAPVLEGPVITHVPFDGLLQEGDPVDLEATAEDPDGVEAMELFHRVSGELAYRLVALERGDDDTWRGTIPGEDVDPPGVEYYLRAFDGSAWRVPGNLPALGPSDPFTLPVGAVPTDVPYVQPFDAATSAFGIYELGWTEAALGFRGERWDLGQPAVAGRAAVHGDGYAGIEPVDDWLITPPLDFTGLVSAEVRWSEYGERTNRAGVHGLYVSLGSPDPADGAFVKVVDLGIPAEGVWSQPPVVDLSEWVGEPAVTLAWRYQGGDSDLWAIDDVRVRELGPDLRILSVSHGRVDPGGGTALDLVVQNLGAPTAGPVSVGLSVDPARGTPGEPWLVGPLGPGAQASGSVGLAVAADHPDNTVLPGVLTATDGVDAIDVPVDVLVGDPTTGTVRLQTSGPGVIQVWMGTGNPLQPHVEVPVFLGGLQAGFYTFQVDLGDHVQYLPSEPGRLRWWVRLNTQEPSQLLGFGIDFDGSVAWTETVGPFPPGQDATFYLPGRAKPVLAGAVTVPSPLVPGQDGVLQITLRNDGGATNGRTEARLSSGDPDLVLLEDELQLAGPSGWPMDAVSTIAVPVHVDASHTDSTTLPLTLTVWDTVEYFDLAVGGQVLPLQVPVPWPDVRYTGPTVDDGGGNGLLDPGETAVLQFTARNDGALATEPLSCTLTPVGVLPVSIPVPTVAVGRLQPGATRTVSFGVTSTGGSVGDELSFTLRCVEGGRTWTGVLPVVLGGVGWSALPLDPAGDALPGASFDLREGRWRVDGDVLSLELTGVGPIDPSALAMELWMDSQGSVWQFHALTVQAGVPQLWGVQFGGFNALSVPVLTAVDADTIRLDLDLPSMALAQDSLVLAVGTGFCGAASFYCDTWPDAWGNPYTGPIDPATWMPLSW